MILGLLAERGEMHGHQVRRLAELSNAEAWGGITGGALYRELHRLAETGLVEPVRNEQVGKRPPRVVYRITDEGHLELAVQRDQALHTLSDPTDPVAVLVLFAAGDNRDDLTRRLSERRQLIAARLQALRSERVRLTENGHLDWRAIAAFRRGELRWQAELDWHDEFESRAVDDDPPPDEAD